MVLVAEPQRPPSRSEQEARRALLHEALVDLAGAPDPQKAADDAMRALDAYIDSQKPAAPSREPSVVDWDRHKEQKQIRAATWLVLGGAVLATIIVAILLSGGWPAGLAIIGIWAVALFALTST